MNKMVIQKSHYEIVVELFHKSFPFSEYTYEEFLHSTFDWCGKDPTYEQFVTSPFLRELALAANEPGAKTHLTTLANIMYHIYLMYQHHERLYYISPNLAVNLAHTELNIDTRFLKSPFPEIYIQIDPGLFYITDPATPDRDSPVRGFYVNTREVDGQTQVRIAVCALGTNYSEISKTNDDSIFYFKIFLGPGKVKDEVRKYILENVQSKADELIEYGGHYNLTRMEDLFFFVFNCLMYMTSKDTDIINQLPFDFQKTISGLKNKGKIRKMMKRQSRSSGLPILVVGSRELCPYKPEDVKNAGGVGKWKLEKRVYVSGHWRIQWYGSEKDNSRHYETIFIKPYVKGPELAKVIQQKYQVGTQ